MARPVVAGPRGRVRRRERERTHAVSTVQTYSRITLCRKSCGLRPIVRSKIDNKHPASARPKWRLSEIKKSGRDPAGHEPSREPTFIGGHSACRASARERYRWRARTAMQRTRNSSLITKHAHTRSTLHQHAHISTSAASGGVSDGQLLGIAAEQRTRAVPRQESARRTPHPFPIIPSSRTDDTKPGHSSQCDAARSSQASQSTPGPARRRLGGLCPLLVAASPTWSAR